MKPIYKKILKIVGIVLGIILIYYLAFTAKLLWDSYQWQKKTEQFEETMRKPYKEDIYGGKTPEETWSMFLDALKKGDIDLASKYYDVEHQEKVKKWLEDLKNNNKLDQVIKDMMNLKKVKWDEENKWHEKVEDRAYYFYDYKNDKIGEVLSSPVNFYLNPYTKVWKILY